MAILARSFDRHVVAAEKLIGKLDERADQQDKRADRQDIAMARLLGALAAVMFLAQILAPYIQRLVGLPTS